MKTLQILSKTFIASIMMIGLVACNDEDEIAVTLNNGTYTVNSLNTCDIGSGALASEFDFDLQFEAPSDIEIDGVEFDLLWSNGADSQNIFTDDFEVDEGTLEFDWCFRFGTTDWFELEIKILAENESIESNTITIRVEKPSGSN